MPGYIITLDSLDSLELYIVNGVYATKLSPPTTYWKTHHEATLADYATMKAGDNIYFFIDRKIYGIGELINLHGGCKFSNLPEASIPQPYDYVDKKPFLLWDEGDFSINQRWLCVFKPAPYFFASGIDMDDVLTSNPSAFKMLRAFWKVSFIKFADEENQAFKDVILKFNQNSLLEPQEGENVFRSDYLNNHTLISKKLSTSHYNLDVSSILSSCAEDNHLKHEMALEAGILYQLSNKDPDTLDAIGNWDYLSHQVIASPFKPVDYMDKMDIFGYSYIKDFVPTKLKYLVAEVKKDPATTDDIEQLLKYVDWVKDEYCHGDYSMITAFLIAYDFDANVINHKQSVAKRKYTIGRRPARTLDWEDLRLINYSFDKDANKVVLKECPSHYQT